MIGHIFDIKKFAIHDGPGIRTTVFLKGCPLRCWWCHNPESIKQIPENGNGFSNGYCESSESTFIKQYSGDEVLNILKKDLIFYDESGGGATFSGGEPLIQVSFLEEILRMCKKNSISTTVDTCGYVATDSFKKVFNYTDLFLYDLKIFDDELHTKYTGVSNKLIKENLEFLNSVNSKVVIRIPLIPDITDTEENLSLISNYLLTLNNIHRVDLLPYNKLAEDKYRRLNQDSKLGSLEAQSLDRLEKIKKLVESFGFETELNG
jgi:pyruvate formate lyase activating enzyme